MGSSGSQGGKALASARSIRAVVVLVVLAFGLLAAPAVQAAIPSIPDGAGGQISCTVQTGSDAGVRVCSGIFTSFDGAPIDVNVGFPPAPASGPDGNYPIVGLFHGWGGAKLSATSGGWVHNGYAFFSMSDRGWGNSCGGEDPKRAQPVCAHGYNHLMDTRFEVRDAQEVFEALADRAADGATNGEGLINPQAIGVTGSSYGGGLSMALAALKDRKMVQDGDGTLVPWVSPGGKQMRIAAAQPDIPWTDLAYSLQPNGHTLDYVVDSPYLKRGRIGILKQSFVAGLYGLGLGLSNYAPLGTDPDADLDQWYAAVNAGEPYDQNPLSQDIVDELTSHHSSYYIDHSTAPAPLLISNGFTDDLFPPDEAIRFYNRTRAEHPGTPVSLLFSDHGHQRGQNKAPDAAFLDRQLHNWFDYYVKGAGPAPFQGVQTLTQVCGGPSGGATGAFDDPDTDLPYRAPTWASLAPGEVRFESAPAQVIAPGAADQGGAHFDPIAGGGACATASADDQPGTASYRLPPAPFGGLTLMGSPTIVANVNSPGPTSQIAARLLDVDPNTNQETLVARGLYRPEINSGTDSTRQVFQLHPNGYRFATEHIAKLELLPADQPYGRNSNGQLPVTVSDLEVRLPVLEQPGSDELVQDPAPKVVPAGYQLSADYATPGYPRPKGATPFYAPLVIAYQACTAPNRQHAPPLSFPSCNPARPTSDQLTAGTPDANGQTANFNGFVSYKVVAGDPSTPADEADASITISLSDVRNQGTLSDYTGEVREINSVRMTDRNSGGRPATAQEFSLPVTVPCAATADPAVGATCSANTTVDALVPGAIAESQRSVWELGEVQVYDGGADGLAATEPNSLFARQGIFTP
jgi:hypothetical protein